MTGCAGFVAGAEDAGRRLDQVLARRVAGLSRSAAAEAVRAGRVRVDGRPADRAACAVRAGARIEIDLVSAEPAALLAEPREVPILYQDEDLIVVDKPAGLVVHPAHGHSSGTLVHALLGRTQLAPGDDASRPGIVHRLDRDTSGCLVVARTREAREGLLGQFRAREVRKTYLAVVRGGAPAEGRIEAAIGRHPRDRKRMAVRRAGGRDALTRFRRLESFTGASLLEIDLATGRTHQIRVHLAHIGHPVLGDPVYGRSGASPAVQRLALHALRIGFRHPRTGASLTVEAPLPPDLVRLLDRLRAGGGGTRVLE